MPAMTVKAVGELSKAFALAVPHEKALEIRDDLPAQGAPRRVFVTGGNHRFRPGFRSTFHLNYIRGGAGFLVPRVQTRSSRSSSYQSGR